MRRRLDRFWPEVGDGQDGIILETLEDLGRLGMGYSPHRDGVNRATELGEQAVLVGTPAPGTPTSIRAWLAH